jgi:hypothetical protein
VEPGYGAQQAVCPRCGSQAEVRTVKELFDMINAMQANAMRQAEQLHQGGFGQVAPAPAGAPGAPGQIGPIGPAPNPSVRGWEAEPRPIGRQRGLRAGRTGRRRSANYDPEQELTNYVLEAAVGAMGRAIGNRMQRAYAERIIPALQAQLQQAQGEQAAIVERYPELRGCWRDQVLFLDGGSRTLPASEIHWPVTLAQADVLVARLRAS